MNRISPGMRRLLALTLLALPALLAWALLLAPWMTARETNAARIAQALALETRALAVAARGPTLAEETEALRATLAGGAEGIPGASHALAGAALQQQLRAAAARHGGAVQSIETLPEGRAGDGMVGVRARLQASAEGLRDLLAGLEAGRAPLQVWALALTNAPVRGGPPLLEVQVELRGLRGAAP
jgi:hypothetical protein